MLTKLHGICVSLSINIAELADSIKIAESVITDYFLLSLGIWLLMTLQISDQQLQLTFTSSDRFNRICCRRRPSSARTRFCHSDNCGLSTIFVPETGWLLAEDTLILYVTCQSQCTYNINHNHLHIAYWLLPAYHIIQNG